MRLTASDIVEVVVNPVNDIPNYTSSGDMNAIENHHFTDSLTAFDIDEDNLTYIESTIPDWISLEHINDNGEYTCIFTGIPNTTDIGDNLVIFNLTDNHSDPIQIFFNIIVEANDPPEIVEVGDQDVDEDDRINMNLTFNDSDNENHSISIESDNENVVVENPDSVSYSLIPEPDWYGFVNITVTVTEIGNDPNVSDSEIYQLTVNPMNDAPENTEFPSIDDTLSYYVNDTIFVNNGIWNDDLDEVEGSGYSFNPSYSYQWYQSDDNIAFTTITDSTKNYLVVPEDYSGKHVRCKVTITDDGEPGNEEAAENSNSVPILNSLSI